MDDLLKKYNEFVDETSVFPKEDAFFYTILGLASEAGEVAGHAKRIIRGDEQENEEFYQKVAKELGDILWYVTAVAHSIDMSIEDIIEINIKKLTKRKEENKIKGRGDDR